MTGCWVFGYGSLMWRPGFKFDKVVPARLDGAHRALCIYSLNHRGTRSFPGLVFGLDLSGSCDGLAFHVPGYARIATKAYLRSREQVSNVYNHAMKSVTLMTEERETVKALTYLVNRRHRQYAGVLTISRQADIVRRARGKSGRNMDYVINTVRHLRELGIHDKMLERLAGTLGRRNQMLSRCNLKTLGEDHQLSHSRGYVEEIGSD